MAARAGRHAADRFEHHRLVALYRPGRLANIPTYCAASMVTKEPEYLHPSSSRPEGTSRHHLPGAGDADRAAQWPVIRSAKPTCCVVHGQENPPAMEKQRAGFVAAHNGNNVPKGQRIPSLTLLAKFADYGFQQEPAAAYPCVVSHRLHEGALPG